MSKTKAELMQKWIEQAEEGRFRFEKEYFQKKRDLEREHHDAVVIPEEARQHAKNAKDPIKDKTYWELVNHEAHNLINENFAGYNDWAIAMSGLVHIAMLLSKAMWYDPPEYSNLIPHAAAIGGLWTSVNRQAYDSVIGTPVDRLRKGKVETDKLPGVGFKASLDAQGKLVLDVTVDGEPERPTPFKGWDFPLRRDRSLVEWANMRRYGELNSEGGTPLKVMLDIGVVAWAKSRGYDLDSTTGTFKDADGKQLTNEKFQELNNDSDLGLNNFIAGNFMPVDFTLGPRP